VVVLDVNLLMLLRTYFPRLTDRFSPEWRRGFTDWGEMLGLFEGRLDPQNPTPNGAVLRLKCFSSWGPRQALHGEESV
jgi:hypothetical protein